MANQVKMSGWLPGKEKNGLTAHEDELLGAEPPETVVAVVTIERKKRTVDDDSDEVTAAVRITALEPLAGEDREAALTLLSRNREQRTGAAELDMDGADS